MSKIFLALSLLVTAPLAAQDVVGYPPARSPYQDVESSQHITLLGGYFSTQQDEIGATPRGGALFGLRYDVPVSGPAEFFVRAQRVSSHRAAFDPAVAPPARALGTESVALYIGDIGFALNLTGRKSWHGLIPVIAVGLGVATASGTSSDKDPYNFGTQFAITSDAGVRLVPGKSFEIRLMAHNTMYQNHYPSAYFAAPATGVAPLLATSTARSGFRSNWSYTGGLAVPIFR